MEERDSRARSIKTRIETGEAHQGKNSLVLFESKINSSVQFMLIVRTNSRARSIKTRIETGEAHQGKNSLVLFESKIH